MRKLNNKGYMLVEIILAFAITFALIYFLMDLVLNLKNKNDDLVVETVIKTDQTIISNKLMDYIVEETSDSENVTFDCKNIEVVGKTVKYNDNILGIVDDNASISYDAEDNCSNVNGKISIRIPVEVKQMPDEDYDIVVDYRYKLMHCNPLNSYNCKDKNGNWRYDSSKEYDFTYTGQCIVESDGSEGDWKIKFLTNGTFTSNCEMLIDAFLVGGGGGGAGGSDVGAGGGGGGGYTTTGIAKIVSNKGEKIEIGIGGYGGGKHSLGGNGGNTTAFGLSAFGGNGGYNNSNGGSGGAGGSGGGGGGQGQKKAGAGGTNGSSGATGVSTAVGGAGQGPTTREFGESTGTLYAGGGGGGAGRAKKDSETNGGDSWWWGSGTGGSGGGGQGGGKTDSVPGKNPESPKNGVANTGGGGGGGHALYSSGATGGNGGSGIVVIRNMREHKKGCSNGTLVNFDFIYTGKCEVIQDDDINWRIRFLTNGMLISENDEELPIDVFLVGGGGGGGDITGWKDHHYYSGGGGGGGYTTNGSTVLFKNGFYNITIGLGGAARKNGGTTSAFSLSAAGGKGSTGPSGGDGGSGGGAGGWKDEVYGGNGGSNGGSGGNGGYKNNYHGGAGQGPTTREFGDPHGKLYAGGGGGGPGSTSKSYHSGSGGAGGGAAGKTSAQANTGGGGGGGYKYGSAGSGGSGIVVIRNKR